MQNWIKVLEKEDLTIQAYAKQKQSARFRFLLMYMTIIRSQEKQEFTNKYDATASQ